MDTIAIALCLLPAAFCGLSEGLATGKAVDAVARQPEASGKITSMLMMGLALTEASSIYGFVIALIMLFR
ncbi:MAG: ATP synthase F0 subunit C [Lachnospiraceae bacterium]